MLASCGPSNKVRSQTLHVIALLPPMLRKHSSSCTLRPRSGRWRLATKQGACSAAPKLTAKTRPTPPNDRQGGALLKTADSAECSNRLRDRGLLAASPVPQAFHVI